VHYDRHSLGWKPETGCFLWLQGQPVWMTILPDHNWRLPGGRKIFYAGETNIYLTAEQAQQISNALLKAVQQSAKKAKWRFRLIFGRGKPLSSYPWRMEALCDGCGQCCLYNWRMRERWLIFDQCGLPFLDHQTCQCQVYPERHQAVPTCVQLTPQNVLELNGSAHLCL